MRNALSALSLSIAACLCPVPAGAADLSGKVVNVFDGDTLTLLVEQKQVTVSLAEIDAPELGQAFGEHSKQSLAQLCLHKNARLALVDRNRSGQIIARVKCEGLDANAEQVGRGMAWVHRRQSKATSPLYFLEDSAQRARAGLWADVSPAPPWHWRSRSGLFPDR